MTADLLRRCREFIGEQHRITLDSYVTRAIGHPDYGKVTDQDALDDLEDMQSLLSELDTAIAELEKRG